MSSKVLTVVTDPNLCLIGEYLPWALFPEDSPILKFQVYIEPNFNLSMKEYYSPSESVIDQTSIIQFKLVIFTNKRNKQCKFWEREF